MKYSIISTFLFSAVSGFFTGASASQADDRLLLIDGDREVMVGDVTMIPYDIAVSKLKELDRRWQQKLPPEAKMSFPPVSRPLTRFREATTATEHYHQLLRYVAATWVEHQISLRIRELLPIPPHKYCQETAIDEYAIADAAIFRRHQELLERVFHETETLEGAAHGKIFRDEFLRAFPRNEPLRELTLKQLTPSFSEQLAAKDRYRIQFLCTPVVVDGEAVPWFHHYVELSLTKYCLIHLIEQSPERFIDRLVEEMGQQTVLVIKGECALDDAKLLALAAKVISPDGSTDEREVRKAEETLHKLAEKSELSISFGPANSLKERLSTDQELTPGKVVHVRVDGQEIRVAVPHPPVLSSQLAVSAKQPDGRRPGTFVWDIAVKDILPPIAAPVINRIKVADWLEMSLGEDTSAHAFHIDTELLIYGAIQGNDFLPEKFGEPLPQVKIETP